MSKKIDELGIQLGRSLAEVVKNALAIAQETLQENPLTFSAQANVESVAVATEEEPKKPAPKKTTTRKSTAKKAAPKAEEPKPEPVKEEAPKEEAPKKTETKSTAAPKTSSAPKKSTAQNPIIKMLTSATFVRGVFGVLSKLMKK